MKHEEGCGHDHDHDRDHDHDHNQVDSLENNDERQAASSSDLSVEMIGDVTQAYSGNGVQFRYPPGWTVEEETGPEQTTITVQSPGTAYWTLSLFAERPDPEQIVSSVMTAYEELYEDLDVYESDVQFLGAPALARDLDFVCLDLVSSVSLIVFQSLNHTVLVLFQGEDRELKKTRPLLELMTQTLLCDLD